MDKSAKLARYYNLSLRYLSYRPRSNKEMSDYLKKKKLPEEEIDEIMNKLAEYKFLDDKKFAKLWTGSRLKTKNKPYWIIERELKQKGISPNLIEEIMPQKTDKNKIDLESARQLAEKKSRYYRNLDAAKRKEKVSNYLYRKGFNYDTIKKVVN